MAGDVMWWLIDSFWMAAWAIWDRLPVFQQRRSKIQLRNELHGVRLDINQALTLLELYGEEGIVAARSSLYRAIDRISR